MWDADISARDIREWGFFLAGMLGSSRKMLFCGANLYFWESTITTPKDISLILSDRDGPFKNRHWHFLADPLAQSVTFLEVLKHKRLSLNSIYIRVSKLIPEKNQWGISWVLSLLWGHTFNVFLTVEKKNPSVYFPFSEKLSIWITYLNYWGNAARDILE